ncbi:hypothetical protein BN6_53030 [Saccharothrix espanaensis DSM 44229]|uniref:Uncharacterized protein n=1 Tax=Saccharothrix espanaensis (strain ATCC 51144 / DSM 44229 / JCM 9112 / NBRC 15066 / NRRL 15764) TaxID=1179773 RepID=K0K4Q3_SACES|nr:hypothetical protein BN6_53030 [Saccharothrix espanaensis DSM 44229]
MPRTAFNGLTLKLGADVFYFEACLLVMGVSRLVQRQEAVGDLTDALPAASYGSSESQSW